MRIIPLTAVALLVMGTAPAAASAPRATDSVDEIHYEYGAAAGTVVLDWYGPATSVSYGLTTSYGATATGIATEITPVDSAGPFMHATLSGLAANTVIHYRIGPTGLDHTLRAAPTGSFHYVDVGDTGTTLCDPWMAQQQQLIADQGPAFVTHGGDISYANECGQAAVHRYFTDQQVWSTSAAFQPAWGNHEYGPPNDESPAGTPRDTMANYKGRVQLTNTQTLPSSDTASKRSDPGCAGPKAGNNCQGDDWGWFRAGGILFISYPEPWYHAYANWEPAAAALMKQAQADPSVDFIVTYGHRPAYSSVAADTDANLRSALTTLSAAYSPTAKHPAGKFVLTVAHHVHAEEVFKANGGLVEINDGGGGAGQVTLSKPASGSILRITHMAVMRGDYDASAHTLTMTILCGAVYTPNPKYTCSYGKPLYTQTFAVSRQSVTQQSANQQSSTRPSSTLSGFLIAANPKY
jgi:hypothetical protein